MLAGLPLEAGGVQDAGAGLGRAHLGHHPLGAYVTFRRLIRPPAAWAPKVRTAIRAYIQALGFLQGCPWRLEVFQGSGQGLGHGS